MKQLRNGGISGKNIPMLLLLAAGIIEFLMITLESRFSCVPYYLAESWLMVPGLLFLGYVLREGVTPFARRRLLLSAAAVGWFCIVQIQHKLSGMENHPLATLLFVYLMAFPFASAADDREDAGIRLIGKLLLTASLVLVGYTLQLVLGLVPEGFREYVFWDGARLHALWHPNMAACYFMIGIGFAAAFLVRSKKTWVKCLLALAILAQYLAMSLTNCRTTLLLTGALFGGMFFFACFKGGWKQLVLGLLAAAVLLVGTFKLSGTIFRWNNDRLVSALSASVEVQETLPAPETAPAVEEQPGAEAVPAETAPVIDDTGIITGDNWQGTLANDMRTLNGRTLIWRSALCAIRDNRTLALWGTEYSGTVISVYNPFEVVHAHNSWMEALLRMGLPGLAVSLVFTAIAIISAAKLLLRKDTELWKKILAMTTICVMGTGFLEPYLFITNVYYHIMDFVFFFCTGYLDYWCRPAEKQ